MCGIRKHELEVLLLLDGDRYFIDEVGDFEVCFSAKRIPVSAGKPFGVSYSLVLIDRHGERIVGFDNAHAVHDQRRRSRKKIVAHDHKHVGGRMIPYRFQGAEKLVADFWREVDKVLSAKN